MPKVTLNYNLPEEQEEFKRAIEGMDAHLCLWDIAQDIFRPARKHGYPDSEISKLLEKIGDDGSELIGILESRFYDILRSRNIDLG